MQVTLGGPWVNQASVPLALIKVLYYPLDRDLSTQWMAFSNIRKTGAILRFQHNDSILSLSFLSSAR